jgi:beta-1,4-mannosyl-glycoprotein beta-1,4-N-acetylglucosaminyltransferase
VVIDAFLFYFELDILRLRLETLAGTVDQFLLVRGDRTFRGRPTSDAAIDDGLTDLCRQYPLISAVVPLPVEAPSPWEREDVQRNAISDCMKTHCRLHPRDTILISDVDEIPDPRSLAQAAEVNARGQIAALRQLRFYFALNLFNDRPWHGTRVLSAQQLERTTPKAVRQLPGPGDQTAVTPGGWHFTWQGNNDAIRKKVFAYSHEEHDRFMSDEQLDACRKNRLTVQNRLPLRALPLGLLPKPVQEHPERYQHLLVPP